MKKFSATFILIAAIICISVTALAAGLIFSPTYDVVRIANQAMEEQYGITPELLSMFCRDVKKNEDGTSVVTFWVNEDAGPDPARAGIYKIIVNGSDVKASWSNEGKDTSGGLAAEAYGPEQLYTISRDYENAMQQLIDLGIIQVDHTQANPRLEDEEIHEWTEEDQAEWEKTGAEEEAAEKQRLAEIAEAESHGTITVEQAAAIAKEAVIQEYGLTKEQSDKLEFETDFTYVSSQGDEPLVDLCFTLWQKEGDTFTGENFTEKDGQYWVTINLKTGIIEDVLYDAGLAANG